MIIGKLKIDFKIILYIYIYIYAHMLTKANIIINI
jgi:hypothetical protein